MSYFLAINFHFLFDLIFTNSFPPYYHTTQHPNIAGGYVVLQGDARFHTFTRWFFYISFFVTIITSSLLLIERVLLRLILTKCSDKLRGCAWYNDFHAVLGFILLMPPLCMMLQFLLYSLAQLIIPGKSTPQQGMFSLSTSLPFYYALSNQHFIQFNLQLLT